MTCKINADTSNGLKLESDTSGVIDIQDNGTTRLTIGDTIDIQGTELVLDADADTSISASTDDVIVFDTGGSEKMRLTAQSFGELLVATTDGTPWDNNNSDPGCGLNTSYEGLISAARSGGDPLALNRMTSDGHLVAFYQDGSIEGTISVSGSTVSYNAFTGSHWSRLADDSKPTILKGTIIFVIIPNQLNLSKIAASSNSFGILLKYPCNI